MHTVDRLAQLPAEAFRNPDNFRVAADDWQENADLPRRQAAVIAELAPNVRHFVINANGTWGAEMTDGGILSTYETIGYHSGTAALLRAILDTGKPVIVYRRGLGGVWIQ